MANYVTITSDKKKGVVLLLWFLGIFGMFPFYYWYVGRRAGIFRWLTLNYFLLGGIRDLFRIVFGSFRDNVGAPLRQ